LFGLCLARRNYST